MITSMETNHLHALLVAEHCYLQSIVAAGNDGNGNFCFINEGYLTVLVGVHNFAFLVVLISISWFYYIPHRYCVLKFVTGNYLSSVDQFLG